jgi:hypothetical protein
VPSVRTIGRILVRRGALDVQRRVRRPPPPVGWYLPDVALRRADVDSVDAIEDLCMVGGTMLDVLTCVSLHGGLPGAWPGPTLTTERTMASLLSHWSAPGLPAYVQFDNAPVFLGSPRYPNALGRAPRLCLGLGVVPVFVPPRESGFQVAVEGFHGRWQAKVWHRFAPSSVPVLKDRSQRYLAVSRSWLHRLVRCEVALHAGHVSFYALRRRAPTDQPLVRTTACRWRLRSPSG